MQNNTTIAFFFAVSNEISQSQLFLTLCFTLSCSMDPSFAQDQKQRGTKKKRVKSKSK
jgi:hypothetical protein